MNTDQNEALLARIAYLEEALDVYGAQLRALNDAVHGLQILANEASPVSHDVDVTWVKSFLKMRRLFEFKPRANLSEELPQRNNENDFEGQLEILKTKRYGAFDEWFKLLEPNLVSYQTDPAAGISVEENEGAMMFREFVAPYSQGSVLDVGCGIASMPVYLQDFNPKLVAGSDPLCPTLERNFLFHHGFAELLPFAENSFDNVVIATSMDHFLDPKLALSEVHRVLKGDGRLLLWMGFVPGSEEYDPWSDKNIPIDDYHLFHFDRDWFEAWLTEKFCIEENVDLNSVSSFYACSCS